MSKVKELLGVLNISEDRMMHAKYSVEIEPDDEKAEYMLEVGVTARANFTKDLYGADADGNRGVYQWEMDGDPEVEVDDVAKCGHKLSASEKKRAEDEAHKMIEDDKVDFNEGVIS